MNLHLARILAATVAVAGVSLPMAALAQGQGAEAPTYARPSYASDEETIKGRITSVNGYTVQIRDDRGFIDNVQLHQGTVINPTGLTLAPGMSVTVLGYNRGQAFAANEIDTPYMSYGAYPAYYPYPAYVGYPYWGSSFSLGFRFGDRFGGRGHFR